MYNRPFPTRPKFAALFPEVSNGSMMKRFEAFHGLAQIETSPRQNQQRMRRTYLATAILESKNGEYLTA